MYNLGPPIYTLFSLQDLEDGLEGSTLDLLVPLPMRPHGINPPFCSPVNSSLLIAFLKTGRAWLEEVDVACADGESV